MGPAQTENDPAESRVAATPETVKKFAGLGAEARVEAGAGLKSSIPDQDYAAAGATIAPGALATVKDAHIVLRVRRPGAAEIAGAKKGAAVVAIMDPYGQIEAAQLEALRRREPEAARRASDDGYLRGNKLSNRVFDSYEAIVDACSDAWVWFTAQPDRITSIGTREWACVSQ